MSALNVRSGGLYLDATFGAGGYTRALLDAGAQVIALDRDPSAIAAGASLVAQFPQQLQLLHARFGDLANYAQAVDGIVLDIGVSSMQIDTPERGFSLRFDAPLDMRMERQGVTAAEILAKASQETLADIFFRFGEERAARRIARAIVADRQHSPFVSTLQLTNWVARIAHAPREERTHPATRVFQALRIAVNDELSELQKALQAAERVLKPGGRLVVVTFHSLEDRIVKQFFVRRARRGARSRLLPGEVPSRAPSFMLFPHQPHVASASELAANPRARSAKLRFAERLEAEAWPTEEPLFAVGDL